MGGCSYPAHFTIDNGNIDVIYQYAPGSGYERIPASENLEPGKGYWMLFNNITDKAQLHVEVEITGISNYFQNKLINSVPSVFSLV